MSTSRPSRPASLPSHVQYQIRHSRHMSSVTAVTCPLSIRHSRHMSSITPITSSVTPITCPVSLPCKTVVFLNCITSYICFISIFGEKITNLFYILHALIRYCRRHNANIHSSRFCDGRDAHTIEKKPALSFEHAQYYNVWYLPTSDVWRAFVVNTRMFQVKIKLTSATNIDVVKWLYKIVWRAWRSGRHILQWS